MVENIPLKEADIKRAVSDYLQFGQNQGKWWFCRLSAGSFIITNPDGSPRRRVIGAEKGTADFIVIQPAKVQMYHLVEPKGSPFPVPRVTFLEIKSSTGKTSKEQDEFAAQVKQFHCRYFVIKNMDEVMEALEYET